MLSFIVYNNQISQNLDLIIENTPQIPPSNIEYETVTIDGAENLTKIKGFKDIDISFDFAYKVTPEEYLAKKSIIDNWLLGNINKNLVYSLDNFSLYKVKQISIGSTSTASRILRRFTVTFTCEGLKYMLSGLERTTITTTGTILNNFGSYEAKPIIKIYGTGNITVTINGKSFTLSNVSSYVTVNSILKECYKDTTNRGKYMVGDYPILPIGQNTISWTGTVTKLEIIPNWRCF